MNKEEQRKARLTRSVAGVVLGFLVFAIGFPLIFQLFGADASASGGLMGLAVVLGIALAMLGGFLAALVAGYRARLHAGFVAGLIAATSIFALLLKLDWTPGWAQVAALFLMTPAAQIGGRLKVPKRKDVKTAI